MKIFRGTYDWMMRLSLHPRAPYYLSGVTVAEATFFPIPVDIMLLPMSIANPLKAWWYAFITTASSVVGGILGWMIGYFTIELLFSSGIITESGSSWQAAKSAIGDYGIWAVLIASFTPIPYKLVTISAGALEMSLFTFIFFSFIGRGARFYLVAAAGKYLGPWAEKHFLKYIDLVGWMLIGLVVIGYAIYKLTY